MGVELVLNVRTSTSWRSPNSPNSALMANLLLFVIVLAAAEAAVALAIALKFYNNHLTIDVDRANKLKG